MSANDKATKNNRILEIYTRFCEGKLIQKSEEARKFGVDERSIQRDIDDIRIFLDERRTAYASDSRTIEYDRVRKGFIMAGTEESMMSNGEILAISKILMASRAFTRKEMDSIIKKLISGCIPLKNMKLVKELLSNERYHYVELHHKIGVHDKLWSIGEGIKEHNLAKIEYCKGEQPKETVTRLVEPMAILFSEYYFYLNAFIVERKEDGSYTHLYDYPAIFRIDRIKSYKETGEKFQVTYADRFEEGEFRKRIQFMYAGQLMKIRLKFYGESPEPVLDRLPTARVLEEKEHEYLVEAEVYGKGILMWLLSQGKKVEVLHPESLRQDMKREVEGMLEFYCGGKTCDRH